MPGNIDQAANSNIIDARAHFQHNFAGLISHTVVGWIKAEAQNLLTADIQYINILVYDNDTVRLGIGRELDQRLSQSIQFVNL